MPEFLCCVVDVSGSGGGALGCFRLLIETAAAVVGRGRETEVELVFVELVSFDEEGMALIPLLLVWLFLSFDDEVILFFVSMMICCCLI